MTDDIELQTAWDHTVAPSPRSREVFDDLIGRHRQPHRRYHGVRHVVWVLRHARALESAIPTTDGVVSYDADAVSAAAFFHDAIYDPERSDNEARSAMLAEHQLATLGWETARRDVVAALVRATAGHLTDEGAADDASTERMVLLDADLAILGSDPNAYAAYATGVRVEYGHLRDEEWRAGRAAVLRHLLDREHLYASAPARTWWEARAKANLTAEFASLNA
jgi:predicted metal-dependent HD superfamily phosphohydrolase